MEEDVAGNRGIAFGHTVKLIVVPANAGTHTALSYLWGSMADVISGQLRSVIMGPGQARDDGGVCSAT
jgi:hypothetical protein